ncbi:Phosphohydrolase (MutT/nudix family protein) [Granulibacter bethesdensis]|uniref:Phosphohydrolase (MutT/nudix family protein) n=1 Tax=Granulibacter bethesdensis TaxID=364410 RepID=A0AAC9P941_9PROT|nr:hypothetical protein [Granulibacter bethesdensis]APH55202.1 Phosphohydrolase (MutT/nudix family protein) [Granulibacter bethesdensis]APH62789.1 Phosphohydrolase (MutT/nudix family protein) [Granulibacter bethesdensis]
MPARSTLPPALPHAEQAAWPVYPVEPEIKARVTSAMPDLASSLDREVERIWQAALQRTGGRLFNGQVFSADELTPALLTGHMTEFRRIVAQMERPDLYEALHVRPLAVCGSVLARPEASPEEGGIIIGRRAGHSVYQAGYWQTPPAGSVDAGALLPDGSLDLRGQLMKELQEELGILPEAVTECVPLLMIEHPDSHVLDIGHRMVVNLTASQVQETHRFLANDEYDPVLILKLPELEAALRGLGGVLSPPSRAIMQVSHWLGGKI